MGAINGILMGVYAVVQGCLKPSPQNFGYELSVNKEQEG